MKKVPNKEPKSQLRVLKTSTKCKATTSVCLSLLILLTTFTNASPSKAPKRLAEEAETPKKLNEIPKGGYYWQLEKHNTSVPYRNFKMSSLPISALGLDQNNLVSSKFCFMLKGLQIGFFALTVLDITGRFLGKPLGFMAIYRFLGLTFGLSTFYMILRKEVNIMNLGELKMIIEDFHDYMYYGYFRSGYIKLLDPPKVMVPSPDGTSMIFSEKENKNLFNYINNVLPEMICYLIMEVLSYLFARALKLRKPYAHWIHSTRFVVGCAFGFAVTLAGVNWWKQENQLRRLSAANPDWEIDRGFRHYVTWVFVILMWIELIGEYLIIFYCSRNLPLYK